MTITLTVKGRMPLWNQVLAMHHWKRKKFKDAQMDDFMSALRASESDLQTKTGSVRNIWSIAADTLASFQRIRRESATSKRRSAKQPKAKKSGPK